ncbi:MAG TPA: dihydrodipicolinate synthase family protein [Bryobacteraceae bacterium]|jgi:dihydrodipicolinate synthase/N-acetylneuraminate lyase|nr:dihydrodipicolinate synthase family protein [Bryobacteraceae bacterium]
MPKGKAVQEIRGVFAALATPRRLNSTEIDSAAFFDYQDAVVRAGVDGVVLFGSTGEFVHFSVADRIQAVSLLMKRGRVPLLVNVSHSTLEGTLAIAESALMAGAAGLLVMPPYFYRYSEGQLHAFFSEVAQLLPGESRLLLYNLPFFTNPLSFPLIERLLHSGQYAGIKDSSGEYELFQQLSALRREHPFIWFAGNELLFLQARRANADGIISGVAGALPELLVALDRSITAGDPDSASALNRLLTDFLTWLERFPATVAIKQAAAVRGWKLNHSAFGFDEATNRDIKLFRSWLEKWLPLMLSECAQRSAMKA